MIVNAQRAAFGTPLALESGHQLAEFSIAYETYGELNARRDNAVLVCHGLTSTQHAAGRHDPADAKPGWWDAAIGPGKPFDTERYFVVSSNALGGFGGSTGPASIDPATGRPYGMRFPVVNIADMVEAQRHLADRLGIARFHTVTGGCMGGFQALEWLKRYPQRVANALIISAGPRVSTHTIALWHVLSEAIRIDPAWQRGDYYDMTPPQAGMALAARIGSLFWMSREVMDQRFALKTVDNQPLSFGFTADFEVEAFLERIGHGAAEKIDANSLLYLMRAMSYFDLSRGAPSLQAALDGVDARTLLVSYANDWRYPPRETEELAQALTAVGAPVSHRVFDSDFGHGAFIYDFDDLGTVIGEFLATA